MAKQRRSPTSKESERGASRQSAAAGDNDLLRHQARRC